MMPTMRTTLTIEDQIAQALKERAFESGKSFKQVVNETLQAGLESGKPKKRRYRVKPVSMGKARHGIDLDKANQIAADLEDDEIARELELRK